MSSDTVRDHVRREPPIDLLPIIWSILARAFVYHCDNDLPIPVECMAQPFVNQPRRYKARLELRQAHVAFTGIFAHCPSHPLQIVEGTTQHGRADKITARTGLEAGISRLIVDGMVKHGWFVSY